MEAADIAREIIAQSKGGHHVAFAFPQNSGYFPLEARLEVRQYNLLFTSTGENGEKFYHVVITERDKPLEFKYSNVDGAIALLAVYDKHLQARFYARFVLYKKGDPNLVQLTTKAWITLEKSDQNDDLWEKSIKKKLHLLDVVDLVEGE